MLFTIVIGNILSIAYCANHNENNNDPFNQFFSTSMDQSSVNQDLQ